MNVLQGSGGVTNITATVTRSPKKSIKPKKTGSLALFFRKVIHVGADILIPFFLHSLAGTLVMLNRFESGMEIFLLCWNFSFLRVPRVILKLHTMVLMVARTANIACNFPC